MNFAGHKADLQFGGARIQFASHASLHTMEDGGLVLCKSLQTLYELNTMGTFIWCCLEEGMTVDQTTKQLVDSLSVRPGDAGKFVQTSISKWWDLGLIAGSQGPSIPASDSTLEEPQRKYIGPDTIGGTETRIYDLLDSSFRIVGPAEDMQNLVHPTFRHLEASGSGKENEILILPSGSDRYDIITDNSVAHEDVARDQLVPTINTHFLLTALNQGTYVLALHGGAVQYKDQVVLLSGPAGSGKSTVTAALIRAGYQYLTDDTIVLAESDLSVRPFPLSLCAKTGSWKVLADHFPEIQNLPTHSRMDGQSMRYLSPAGSMVPAHARPRASHIFFLSYRETRSVGLQPIGKIGAIRRLLSMDWNFIPKRLERDFVSRFVSWIDNVECRSLEFGNLEEAVSAIESELR